MRASTRPRRCTSGTTRASCWHPPRRDAADTKLSEEDLFGPDYLIRRPLLRALEHPGPRPAVLLIDEIDRADDDFEAFLLELLGEAAVTIPEIGTIRATHPPVIVLTSNRTRDLHDAVKRRCLYHWIDYPGAEREVEIIRRRVKGASETLAVQVAAAVSRMRDSDVQKPPGIAEAIDWLAALGLLGVAVLDESAIERTLGSVLKYSEDQEVIRAAGLSTAGCQRRMTALRRRDRGAGPAAAGRRIRSPAARRRRAGHGPALGAVRTRADAGASGLAASAVLDRSRRVRQRQLAAGRVRRRCSGRCSAAPAKSPLRSRRSSRPRPRRQTRATPLSVGPTARGLRDPAARRRPAARDPAPAAIGSATPKTWRSRRWPATTSCCRSKRFDALDPAELAELYRLMARLRLATPMRRTRRAQRDQHGERIDLRRTLRGSLRTGGDPIRLARRRRQVVPRRIVMLCDISGSMEPYARAYLQFLTCVAAGADGWAPIGGVRVRDAADAPDPGAARPATRSGRSSAPPRRRRTGRAAPASVTR